MLQTHAKAQGMLLSEGKLTGERPKMKVTTLGTDVWTRRAGKIVGTWCLGLPALPKLLKKDVKISGRAL